MSDGFKSPLLPLGLGSVPSGLQAGSGHGPLPFIVGAVAVEPVIPVPDDSYGGEGGGGGYIASDYTEFNLRELFKDDEDLVEIMTIVLSSGVLD